jgi:hypothetical protein
VIRSRERERERADRTRERREREQRRGEAVFSEFENNLEMKARLHADTGGDDPFDDLIGFYLANYLKDIVGTTPAIGAHMTQQVGDFPDDD